MVAVAGAGVDVVGMVAVAAVTLGFPFLFPFAVARGLNSKSVSMVWAMTMHTMRPAAAVKTIRNCWNLVNRSRRDVLLHREMPWQMDYI